MLKIFDTKFLDALTEQARNSGRSRANVNIHSTYQEACQRFFNAVEPDSYIRPHRHQADPKPECLIAARGLFALVIFDDNGSVSQISKFGAQGGSAETALGAEIPPSLWHTVIALRSGSILFEVKPGPFKTHLAKEMAAWAPREGSPEAAAYSSHLRVLVAKALGQDFSRVDKDASC